MKLSWIVLGIVVSAGTLVLALPPASGVSAGEIISRNGMKGLDSVYVLVEDLNPEWARAVGLSENEIKTHVELYLRRVPGLQVIDDEASAPFVYVSVFGLVSQPSRAATVIQLSLCQDGTLDRSGPQGQPVWVPGMTTWQEGKLRVGPAAPSEGRNIKTYLTDLLDQFQNEYLKANPAVLPSGAAGAPAEPASR